MSAEEVDEDLVAAAIDEAKYAELAADFDEETAAEIVGAFLESTPEQVELVVTRARGGDGPGAADAAHRLRGGCLAIGARALEQAAATVERAGRNGDAGPVLVAGATDVAEAWEATEVALRRRREG